VPPPAASEPATTPPPEEKKGLGGRVLDFLRGSPAPPTGEPPADHTQDEIRDRMIRGGGTRSR
jgi:hypothetical protein